MESNNFETCFLNGLVAILEQSLLGSL